MSAAANCSRRLLTRSPSAVLALIPARAQLPATTSVAASLAAGSIPLASYTPSISYIASRAALFSTSSSNPAKGGASHYRPGRNAQSPTKKKKPLFSRGKAVLPGERKAYRKRIVLSNVNALEVAGLEQLTSAHLCGQLPSTTTEAPTTQPESLPGGWESGPPAAPVPCDGRIAKLPDALIDQLRAVQAFKPTQNFKLFRHPSLLLRSETAELVNKMKAAVSDKKQALRMVIDGKRIAGKSTMLMQAMSYAFLDGWLVFHIPEAQELANGSVDYAPLPNSDPTQYLQPTATLAFLRRFMEANAPVLSKLTTAHNHSNLSNAISAGSTLLQLTEAAKEPDHAWDVLQALLKELSDPKPVDADGKPLARPPVLFTADGISHIMKPTAYKKPSLEPIHAHDLTLVRFFVDSLSGAIEYPHGAAIIGAISRGNYTIVHSLDLALGQRRAEQANVGVGAVEDKQPMPVREPYKKGYDDRVEAVLKNVDLMTLGGVSKPEARSLMEYWAASGVVRQMVTEQEVTSLWSLNGNGLVGEMERSALLSVKPGMK